ncbi:MAG: Asp-tRNA(Asn) amidotransferase GatCAB subunit C [bacterium]|nr:Asp-tRNA(Asn) amidotransferase GatCAB subunit C [bacterium]
MDEEKILQQALEIINDFTKKLLARLETLPEEEITEETSRLAEDKPCEQDKEFREIFLKNARTEKDYIVVEKASWYCSEGEHA